MLPIALALASQFAPAVVKYLSGSDTAAAVAGQVVGIAQAVTGAATPEAAQAALAADPALALAFREKVMASESDLEKAYLGDRKDARAMQVAALGQDDLFSKRFVYYFASAWSLFAMFYFSAVTFWPPNGNGQRIADTILGVLIASVVGVMFSYFYGTTRGSKDKDATIAGLMK